MGGPAEPGGGLGGAAHPREEKKRETKWRRGGGEEGCDVRSGKERRGTGLFEDLAGSRAPRRRPGRGGWGGGTEPERRDRGPAP